MRNDNFETCAKTEVVKNTTVYTDLWRIFCDNATCHEYFSANNLTEILAIPGLRSGVIKGGEGFQPFLGHSLSHGTNPITHSFSPLDNLWGDYGPVGTYVEKKSQPSVPVQDTSTVMNKQYVINDITTYFTLLVGIYFPSVTGRFLLHQLSKLEGST